jgi:hypothetical protein
MARMGRPAAAVELTEEERQTLARWSRRAKPSQARLPAPRHHHLVRRPGCGQRRGHRLHPPPPPGQRVQKVPRQARQADPRHPGRPPDRRPLQHPHRAAITAWLAGHPRFHTHFTPTYSSWLNQAGRWSGLLTDQRLRRGTHRSVQALEKDIRDWTRTWNGKPRPFAWTKTADEILDRLASYLHRIPGAGY